MDGLTVTGFKGVRYINKEKYPIISKVHCIHSYEKQSLSIICPNRRKCVICLEITKSLAMREKLTSNGIYLTGLMGIQEEKIHPSRNLYGLPNLFM